MRASRRSGLPLLFLALLLCSACEEGTTKTPPTPASAPDAAVITLEATPDAHERLQSALIEVKPGQTIVLKAGVYRLQHQVSLDVDRVTLKGEGADKTILSFSGQTQGSEGLMVTSDDFTLEDLAIEDTKGDGIKVESAKNLVIRRVRASQTAGPRPENGGYGLYPVLCENVLLDECSADGWSDSGIYVGQSRHVIIRRCQVEKNVAGIEIENTQHADCHDCTAINNTAGILVFDLPGLSQKQGFDTRVFRNTVTDNNLANFAPQGNFVALVPAGTGMLVMASDRVEFFDNIVTKHRTTAMIIASYLATQQEYDDPGYDPVSEGVWVHDNRFEDYGDAPDQGMLGAMLAQAAGLPVPAIIWDGIVNEKRFVEGKLPDEQRHIIADNGAASFANIDMGRLGSPEHRVQRDLAAHAGRRASRPPVTLPGMAR